jgi:heme-degrading monooxygenase HmoA
MYARLAILQGTPERAKEAREAIADRFVPRMNELPGLKAAHFLQGEDGKVVVLTLFETESDVVAAREPAKRLREAASSELGLTVVSVEELEVIASV